MYGTHTTSHIAVEENFTISTTFRDGQYTWKKVCYVQYTGTYEFLLKIYNIHILLEFWKICNIQCTLASKSIFNTLS